MTADAQSSRIIETSDTVEIIEECYRMGWSDGLPVVPPVEYKVREMLELSGMTGEEEIITFEMRRRVLTAENAAANAVMAGCLPEYFPVLTTALRTLDEEKNYVNMAASSTSSPAILMIVNGPIRHTLEMNARDGIFGPGNRANACIGRAVRLCFMNGFEARPGILDRGTLGNPSKYTLTFAENEEDSPWEPLHVSRGFERGRQHGDHRRGLQPHHRQQRLRADRRSDPGLRRRCSEKRRPGLAFPGAVGAGLRPGARHHPGGRRLDAARYPGIPNRKRRPAAGRTHPSRHCPRAGARGRRPDTPPLLPRTRRHHHRHGRRNRRTQQRHH